METRLNDIRSYQRIDHPIGENELAFGPMPKKKPFVLRLDPETLKAIEKWAADEFRSSNGQLEWIVNKALKEVGRLPKKP